MKKHKLEIIIGWVLLFLVFGEPARAEYPILPNKELTPGGIDLTVTTEQLCLAGYTNRVRNVSQAKKREVYAAYGIPDDTGNYEIDHLVSLELGGDNSKENLWPQSYLTYPWNARIKDRVENKLHRLVCDGVITLEEAQHAILNDWRKAYCKYVDDRKGACNRL